jgi:imidazole glycerol-phosphate synthase subunit HisF
MLIPRIIPCLLLKNLGLVKSIRFKDYRYIGDPMNAVRIFNAMEADELIFLDILASREKRKIQIDLVEKIGDEAYMPFTVGGGIDSISIIKEILNAGAEKVCINSYALKNTGFIKEASDRFGSSTIVVSIDVKSNFLKHKYVYDHSVSKLTNINPLDYAKLIESMGAGELIVNSVDRDGMMRGYDIELIKEISDVVGIPVIALGGAGNINDFRYAIKDGHASAIAAGSMFIYHGPRKAVLINYPTKMELKNIFNSQKG